MARVRGAAGQPRRRQQAGQVVPHRAHGGDGDQVCGALGPGGARQRSCDRPERGDACEQHGDRAQDERQRLPRLALPRLQQPAREPLEAAASAPGGAPASARRAASHESGRRSTATRSPRPISSRTVSAVIARSRSSSARSSTAPRRHRTDLEQRMEERRRGRDHAGGGGTMADQLRRLLGVAHQRVADRAARGDVAGGQRGRGPLLEIAGCRRGAARSAAVACLRQARSAGSLAPARCPPRRAQRLRQGRPPLRPRPPPAPACSPRRPHRRARADREPPTDLRQR